MLIPASFRMRVTSSSPPGLFSRNIDICSTFIAEPPLFLFPSGHARGMACEKNRARQIWRLSCTRLAFPSNRWRDFGSTSFTLAEIPR